MRFPAAFLIGLVCSCFLAAPGAARDADTFRQRAEAMKLSTSPVWLNLLQYDVRRAQPQSDVLPGSFFISTEGHTDPRTELNALIDALFAPIPEDANDHALCRFPARVRFLEQSLGDLPTPAPRCSDYLEWQGGGPMTGAALVYASGSLGEPATFYGHILLKFTSNTTFSDRTIARPTGGTLLDTSINYGAEVPDGELPPVYLLKGLLGGYTSGYTPVGYYEQRGNYVLSQDRDLWEYELNLDDAQLQFLLEATWELYQQDNVYYFFTRNCAYRFAELIALVTGQDIDLGGKPWSMPIDVFIDLAEMRQATGAPIIGNITRVPSPTNRFLAAYKSLDRAQRSALKALVQDSPRSEREDYFARPAISDEEKTEVVETALLYIAMGRARDEGENAERIEDLNREILLKRFMLPQGAVLEEPDLSDWPPHLHHRSAMAQASYLYNSELGGGLELRLRPVFTDLLTLTAPDHPFSDLAMGEIAFVLRDEKAYLQELNLLHITSLYASTSGLPFEHRPSWRFRLGAESERLAADGGVLGFVEYAHGVSVAPIGSTVLYAMGEGRFDTGPRDFQVGLRAGVVSRLSDGLQLAASSSVSVPFERSDWVRSRSGIEVRLGSSTQYDFRFRVRRETDTFRTNATEIGISLSRFF